MFMVNQYIGFCSFADEVGGNDAFTQLLLHMDGLDNGTTFTDSSQNTFSGTASGGAVTHTTSYATPKFGTASGKFPASGGVSFADNAALRPGSGDFTFDWWVRYNTGSAFQTFVDKGFSVAGGILIQTDNAASPKINIYDNASLVLTETAASSTGAWIHKAVVRSSGTLTIYTDGAANGSASNSTNFNATNTLYVGRDLSNLYPVSGNLDEVRFSNTARWTASFTPPAAPYS